ncbi:hypothetical protein HanIR_Chr04g0188381 [Helianthus annuus]|nr:hypothetical protein HanIR_Chr04g0188381 [Helianthus annuus]
MEIFNVTTYSITNPVVDMRFKFGQRKKRNRGLCDSEFHKDVGKRDEKPKSRDVSIVWRVYQF